jgi:G3E family GTPase
LHVFFDDSSGPYDAVVSTIPITVVGGYLGAGKTTLINSLLAGSGGRRIGVVVNDFGELGIDASLLSNDAGHTNAAAAIVNLTNGCVCCTLGDDLGATLRELAGLTPSLDHIVIEASGVADPASAAAWGTVPPFISAGIIVLAAADQIRANARDRYVGGEVQRQLEGADVVVLTKVDLCEPAQVADVREWLAGIVSAPMIDAVNGAVPLDVLLGSRFVDARAHGDSARRDEHDVDSTYVRWAVTVDEATDQGGFEAFLRDLPAGLLRLKGFVAVRTDSGRVERRLVQVVGDAHAVRSLESGGPTRLEAIGKRAVLSTVDLDTLANEYLRRE